MPTTPCSVCSKRRETGIVARDAEESAASSQDGFALEHVLSREPSPEFAAEVAEEYERLLRSLNDRELQAVALARMAGYSVEEIGAQLGFSSRSIERKLQMIRSIWAKELDP